MMFRTLGNLFTMASLAMLALAAAAQEAQTHVHGRASLDIALENNEITATLRTPMDNLVGFEHAPRTAEQRALAEQARKQLQQFDQLLVADPAAKCSLSNVDIAWDALEHTGNHSHNPHQHNNAKDAEHNDSEHTHDHGHENETAHAGSDDQRDGHADAEVTAHFICTGSGNPAYIDARLFQTFPGLHQLVVQVVTPTGQSGATLTRDNVRLRLN